MQETKDVLTLATYIDSFLSITYNYFFFMTYNKDHDCIFNSVQAP